MFKEYISLLGITFLNASRNQIAALILEWIKGPKNICKFVSLVDLNSLFYSKSLEIKDIWEKQPLLKYQMQTDLSVVSSPQIVQIARWMQADFIEVIEPDALLSEMIDINNGDLSLFFVLDPEKEKPVIIEILRRKNSNVRIGSSKISIYVKGIDLVIAREKDDLILEEIHQFNPDIIITNFDLSDQQVWWDRISLQLKVPVLVNFSFERTIQKNFTAIISQIKFYTIALPALSCFNCYQFLLKPFYTKKYPKHIISPPLLFLSKNKTIAALKFPVIYEKNEIPIMKKYLDEAFNQDIILFNVTDLRILDPFSLGNLVSTWIKFLKNQKDFFILGATYPLIHYLKIQRVWNLIESRSYKTIDQLVSFLQAFTNQNVFFDSIFQDRDLCVLSFLGVLEFSDDTDFEIESKYIQFIRGKNCIIDLTYCTSISNTGFIFLIKLKQTLFDSVKSLVILGANSYLKKQFKEADLQKSFTFV